MNKIIKTKDLKVTAENLYNELFFPYDIKVAYDGKIYDFSIEMYTILDRLPDCKIGNFNLNVWFRPEKAIKKDFTGYRTVGDFSRAVKNTMIKKGCKIIGWVKRDY